MPNGLVFYDYQGSKTVNGIAQNTWIQKAKEKTIQSIGYGKVTKTNVKNEAKNQTSTGTEK